MLVPCRGPLSRENYDSREAVRRPYSAQNPGGVFTWPLGMFPGGSDGKASARNAGDSGSIPGSEKSPGEGNGNPLQYSYLEECLDGGAWCAIVHKVANSWT